MNIYSYILCDCFPLLLLSTLWNSPTLSIYSYSSHYYFLLIFHYMNIPEHIYPSLLMENWGGGDSSWCHHNNTDVNLVFLDHCERIFMSHGHISKNRQIAMWFTSLHSNILKLSLPLTLLSLNYDYWLKLPSFNNWDGKPCLGSTSILWQSGYNQSFLHDIWVFLDSGPFSPF